MRKYILILLICLFIPVSVNATSVVMDMDSKRVLSGSAENETKLIASTTKILTAMVVINNTDIKNIVTVDENVLKSFGSGIYIEIGEKISVEDLLYGLLLRSGNDSATAIAEHLGGQSNFIKLMNEKAKLLGLKNTVYQNPTGLDDESKNYSTMKDLAYIYAYSYKNDLFKKYPKLEEIENESLPCIFISVLPILIIFISNFTLSMNTLSNNDQFFKITCLTSNRKK